MKRTILLFTFICISLVRCQCEPDIEDNRRSSFSGKITDSDNSPLQDINVSVRVSDLNLGTSTTSQSGDFNFISLVSTFNNYTILFEPLDVNSEFNKFTLNYLDRTIDDANDLGIIPLPRKSKLEIRFLNNSGNSSIIDVSLEYKIGECNIFNEDNIVPNYENCYESDYFSGKVTPDIANIVYNLFSIMGTSVDLTYQIDTGEIQTISIPLNQSLVIYEIIY